MTYGKLLPNKNERKRWKHSLCYVTLSNLNLRTPNHSNQNFYHKKLQRRLEDTRSFLATLFCPYVNWKGIKAPTPTSGSLFIGLYCLSPVRIKPIRQLIPLRLQRYTKEISALCVFTTYCKWPYKLNFHKALLNPYRSHFSQARRLRQQLSTSPRLDCRPCLKAGDINKKASNENCMQYANRYTWGVFNEVFQHLLFRKIWVETDWEQCKH